MKSLKLIAGIGTALVALLFVSQAHAQVVPTNLWRPNYASGTIAPINSSLQIPCANVVGGCNASTTNQSLNTTSTPTFAGATLSGTSATTTVGTVLSAAPLGYLAVGDNGTYINSLCTSATANASSATIIVPQQDVPSSSYQVPIVFGTIGAKCYLQGQGDGTVWNWGGAQGTVAITNDNFGSSILPHTIDPFMTGINLVGNSATTTNPTVGVFLGGSSTLGSIHTQLDSDSIHGFGIGVETATSTYDLDISNSVIRNNGYNLYFNLPSNSGEGFTLNNDWIVDPANASATNCIYFAPNAVASFRMVGGSLDDCGVNISSGNLFVGFYGVHDENPGQGVYGSYPRFTIATSTGTGVLISGGDLMNDGPASTTPAAPITNSANLTISGLTVDDNGSAAQWTNLVTESPSGTVSISSPYPVGSPYAGLVNGSNPNASSYSQQGTNPPVSIVNGQVVIGATTGQAPLDVERANTVSATGGLDAFFGDTSSTVDYPVTISHKTANAGQIGSYVAIGLNAYVSATNSIQVYNNTERGWLINVDARASASPNLTIQSVSASSTATPLFVMNSSGSTMFGASGFPFCLEGYDSVNSTTKEYWYTASNTITATTTKPSFCQ